MMAGIESPVRWYLVVPLCSTDEPQCNIFGELTKVRYMCIAVRCGHSITK